MKHLILTIFLLSSALYTSAQSLDRLREEQRIEREQIAKLEAELKRIEGSQKNASRKLELLGSKIESRRKLKANIMAQISMLNTRQASLDVQAENNAYRLSELRSHYGDMIERSYRAMMLTGRKTGHDAKRLQYMVRVVGDSMSIRAVRLGALSSQVMAEVRVVELKKASLDRLRASYDKEVALMDKEAAEAEKLSYELQSSAGELSAQAEKRKARLDELQSKIEDAIKREMAKTPTEVNSAGVALSAPLSREFAANKGKLPSPLAGRAKLASRYGVQNSNGVKINNKGIDVRPGSDRTVRAIFGGEVRRVFVIPAMGTCVMVRHGDYMTIYANMESSEVKVGQNITTSTPVGELTVGENLHFELWKASSPLNPSEWIFNIM